MDTKLSPAQRDALEAAAAFGGGDGWAPVELELSSRFPEGTPHALEQATIMRTFKSLERRGLVTLAADGPEVTEQGLALLDNEATTARVRARRPQPPAPRPPTPTPIPENTKEALRRMNDKMNDMLAGLLGGGKRRR